MNEHRRSCAHRALTSAAHLTLWLPRVPRIAFSPPRRHRHAGPEATYLQCVSRQYAFTRPYARELLRFCPALDTADATSRESSGAADPSLGCLVAGGSAVAGAIL